jgi:hypothetical protein
MSSWYDRGLTHYSLIQFCPNPSRLEYGNLGIVVFIPTDAFIDGKIISNNDRIRKFFGDTFDDFWLTSATEAMLRTVEEKRLE